MGKITDIHVFVPGFVFKLHKIQEGGGTKPEIRRVTEPVEYFSPHDPRVANERWDEITHRWYMELDLSISYYGVTDREYEDSPTTFGWIESINEQEQDRFVPLYHGHPGITGDPVLIAKECHRCLVTLRNLLDRMKEVYPEREPYMNDREKKTLVQTVMDVASDLMSSSMHLPIVIAILSMVATNDAIRGLEQIQMDRAVPKSIKIGLVEAIANAKKQNANMRS